MYSVSYNYIYSNLSNKQYWLLYDTHMHSRAWTVHYIDYTVIKTLPRHCTYYSSTHYYLDMISLPSKRVSSLRVIGDHWYWLLWLFVLQSLSSGLNIIDVVSSAASSGVSPHPPTPLYRTHVTSSHTHTPLYRTHVTSSHTHTHTHYSTVSEG